MRCLVAHPSKELPTMQRDQSLILGQEDPSKGMATHSKYSGLENI